MHIPDGYLGPKTCLAFYAVMAPLWYVASKRLERTLKAREIPLVALGAAFVFVVMMFNLPIPGGSTGHIVGAVIVAVSIGPWAGMVAMSLTLALQAFLFGDGGITALGANAFNMAFVMSFSGYYVYRLLASGEPGSMRRWAAAASAAYIAVNLSALAASVELGLQPLVAAGLDGRPLYAPYPFSIAVPAMMVPHLLFLGPLEAVGTALVVSYVARTGRAPLATGPASASSRPLWIALAAMVLLVPLGLIAAGTPWGEWGVAELSSVAGYVPAGMERLAGIWHGVLPGYGAGVSGASATVAYIGSALIGSAAVVAIIYIWARPWRRR